MLRHAVFTQRYSLGVHVQPFIRHRALNRSIHVVSCSSAAAPAARAQKPSATQVAESEHAQINAEGRDAFYAATAKDFATLGVSSAICAALEQAGYQQPSRVQEIAIPPMLKGQNVVLAAETGSGKTLAYIAPLASSLLEHRSKLQPEAHRALKHLALVLCPNVALCEQVVATAEALRGADGMPLLRAVQVSSSKPPPFDMPDIIVATPGGLMALVSEGGKHYGRLWTEEGLALRINHLVVDEADLLTVGSYARDLERLLELLRIGDRRNIESEVMTELGMTSEEYGKLPHHLKRASWHGGVAGMVEAGYRPPAFAGAAAAGGDSVASSSSSSSSRPDEATADAGSQEQPRRYWKRQYVFVAATLPQSSKADLGTNLKVMYPDAVWLSGELLHRSKPQLQQRWVAVDEAGWSQALLSALRNDPDYKADRARTLVFAKDVAAADAVAEELRQARVPHMVYHKGISPEDRAAALATLRGSAGGSSSDSSNNGGSSHGAAGGNAVLVSTDAAARGIDIPRVTHVIQADFAATAVDYLHRVGRTARAGCGGKATNLYKPESAELAAILQEYIAAGRPVEECFSRNRSFSKKLKKHGKFVPRGQAGTGARRS